jgi:hypothetical protein
MGVNVLVKDWHSVTHLIACSAVGKSIYIKVDSSQEPDYQVTEKCEREKGYF